MTISVDRSRPIASPAAPSDVPRESSSADDLPPSKIDPSDTILRLLVLTLEKRNSDQASGENRIASHETLVQKSIDDRVEAAKREAEAQDDSGGFFSGIEDAIGDLTVDVIEGKNIGDAFSDAADATVNSRGFWTGLEKTALDVGKWAAVAGSVALAVCSCGAAAPIAVLAVCGAVMSCAAAADSQFGLLEKCGVDAKTAGWIDVGLAAGGALCSGGAGVAQALGTSASTGASAGVRTVGTATDMASAGATVAGGVAKIEVAGFDRAAGEAAADVKDAERRTKLIDNLIQAILESTRDKLDQNQKQVTRLDGALADTSAAKLAVVRA